MSKHSLQVLVTRPSHQAASLCDKLAAIGATAVPFATLDIVPAANQVALQQQIQALDQYQIAIFTSSNAVNFASPLIKQAWPILPGSLQIFAIGPATEQALRCQQLAFTPLQQSNYHSEALLAHPLLQQVAHQRIALFKGQGGRALLTQTLTQRMAKVEPIICYQRIMPASNTAPLIARWQKEPIDLIISTSNESLNNLNKMLKSHQELLMTTPILVLSERMAKHAHSLGYQDIIVAETSCDDGLIASLQSWQKKHQ